MIFFILKPCRTSLIVATSSVIFLVTPALVVPENDLRLRSPLSSMYQTVPPQRLSVRLKAFPFLSSFFCAMLVSLFSSTTQHTTACSESPLTFFLLFLSFWKILFLCLCGSNSEQIMISFYLPFRDRESREHPAPADGV